MRKEEGKRAGLLKTSSYDGNKLNQAGIDELG